MSTMSYFAHSPKGDIPGQLYEDHINNVVDLAVRFAKEAAEYGIRDGEKLLLYTKTTAKHHDLGKLEEENQNILSGMVAARSLPYHHQDAGVALLLQQKDVGHFLAAAAIAAHHQGYPDFSSEYDRKERCFRDKEQSHYEKTESLLSSLVEIHNSLIPIDDDIELIPPEGSKTVFLRLLLSCLVDADHTDSAANYGNYPGKSDLIPLLPNERLKALDAYVSTLGSKEDERNALRQEMYSALRNVTIDASISSCDSPVGSGKTTAVMAHMLNQAAQRGLRRIFVVLPYTNIIKQSVDEYRKALVLEGENPEEVVAELHHLADFNSVEARYLTSLWRAPIIVTTAVAFFETLASRNPATLRKLHELPGSAIFVDESHAAMPSILLPLAWRWINTFAREWGCYWVLASGSLCRFWEIDEIAHETEPIDVPSILSNIISERLSTYEKSRVRYQSELQPKSIDAFLDWVSSFPGPRLVVLNTVQNAAVLASEYSKRFSREHVEHISTALTPSDRENTLLTVKARLKDRTDTDWTLFATSCVEAGVNLSFRNGFREVGSLLSLLQIAGRVNREGEYDDSEVFSFILSDNPMLINNTSLNDSKNVLKSFLQNGIEISPELSTISISREIRLGGSDSKYKFLINKENMGDFECVQDDFKIIDTDTRLVIVDSFLADKALSGQTNWLELQRNSVQIARHKLYEPNTTELRPGIGIYSWNLKYDTFLGYMAGIIEKGGFEKGMLIV